MSEIEKSVAAYLETIGVKFSVAYKGLKANALDGASAMDQWDCEFTSYARPNEPQQFDFFTGLGLRFPATDNARKQAAFCFQRLTEKDKAGITSYGRQYGREYKAKIEELREPNPPRAATVLYSLVLDSNAAGQSFASWCDDYGYDTDSRKAFATYEACQENADKLGRVLTHAQREHLGELLQDY